MESEKGQTVLVVLLMTAVVLTIGLSVVSRSVTDVHISGQSQESARAFWVAQGKLDEAIRTQSGISGNADNVTYQVTKTGIAGNNQSFLFPNKVEEGRSVNLWLAGHNDDGQLNGTFYQGGNLTLYWGNSPDTIHPALEAAFIYEDKAVAGKYYSARFTFDSNPDNSRSGFSTSVISGINTFNGISLDYKATVDFSGLPNYGGIGSRKPYLLMLKPLFNTNSAQYIVAETTNGTNIFKQGYFYGSTASIDVSNITRKVTEYRFWPAVPEIFSYLLYSGGELTAQ